MSVTVTARIARVDHALAEDRFADALEEATRAWRGARNAALGDLVDAISTKLTPPPLPPTRSKDFPFAWLKLARTNDRAALSTLLPTLGEACPARAIGMGEIDIASATHGGWLERADALQAFEDDPRMTQPLVALLRRADFGVWIGSDSVSTSAYTPMFTMLARLRDARCLPTLRALFEVPEARSHSVRRIFARDLPPLLATLERAADESTLPDKDVAHVRHLITKLTSADVRARASDDELLALVHASPNDDGPRQVYGDALLERGDARGEFIALQFKHSRGDASDKDVARMRALLSANQEAWVGADLMRVFANRAFRRGMLDEVEVAQNAVAAPTMWERATTDPRLATVRVLWKGRGNEAHYTAFAMSKAMRALRHVSILSTKMLGAVCEAPTTWPYEHLMFERDVNKVILARLAETTSLPRLRRLTISGKLESLVNDLARWKRLDGMTELTLRPRASADVSAWLGRTGTLGKATLSALTGDGYVAAQSGDGGLVVRIEAKSPRGLAAAIAGLAGVAELTVRAPERRGHDAPALAEFRDAVKKLAPGRVTLPDSWQR